MKDEKKGEGEIEEEENIDDILEKYKFLTDEKELLGKNKLSEREKMKPELDDELMDRVDAILERYKFCLLYTSPSPRDLSTARMPSSA